MSRNILLGINSSSLDVMSIFLENISLIEKGLNVVLFSTGIMGLLWVSIKEYLIKLLQIFLDSSVLNA